jgi:hypothetical protein
MPRRATQESQRRKLDAAHRAVPLERLCSVLGAARIKSANGWQQPRDRALIQSNCYDEHAHRSLDSRRGASLPARRELSASSALNSCLNCPYRSAFAPGRHKTTNHIPETFASSMMALQRRRKRLRSTAFPTFAVITMPTFVSPCDAGFNVKTERLFVEAGRPRCNTCANSRRRRRLE